MTFGRRRLTSFLVVGAVGVVLHRQQQSQHCDTSMLKVVEGTVCHVLEATHSLMCVVACTSKSPDLHGLACIMSWHRTMTLFLQSLQYHFQPFGMSAKAKTNPE